MARIYRQISLLAVVLLPLISPHGAEPIVKTSRGMVSGKLVKTYGGRRISAFRGIPYAEAPVGDLRFRAPLAKEPWPGILNASDSDTQCLQLSDDSVIGQEDCLLLNVYTPQIKFDGKINVHPLPVMVYIHGGGFTQGTGNYDNYGPGYLLDREIILVTMNYRLDVLGFLSTGDDESPGNFGLKDQLLALRWVQENIIYFGGNPRNVTLFGESAGGASVNVLALSPLSEGLFERYIIQSGSVLGYWAFRNISSYVTHAVRVAELLDCPTDSSAEIVDCLREVNGTALIGASSVVFDPLTNFAKSTWGPTIEPQGPEAIITEYPVEIIARGGMRDLPLITGQVANEGLFVTTSLYADENLYESVRSNIEQFISMAISEFTRSSEPVRVTQKIIDFYFNGNITEDKHLFIQQLTRLLSDSFFLYPEVRMLGMLREFSKSPIYFYSMDYRGTFSGTSETTGTNERLGVPHADDLIYLFPKDPTKFGVSSIAYSDEDIRVKDTMVDLWTTFTIDSLPTTRFMEEKDMWKPYQDGAWYLQIGNDSEPGLTLLSHYHDKRMAFWNSLSEAL